MTNDKLFFLIPLTLQDAPGYFSLIDNNRDRLSRYFPRTMGATPTQEDTLKYVEERVEAAAKKEFITHLIKEVSTEKIIAGIFLKDIDLQSGEAEIGFFIDKEYQGKGIISHFVSEICEIGFSGLGLKKLFMRIAESNIGSIKVAEKNGFSKEGILRKNFLTSDGQLIDLIYYSKKRKPA